MKEIAIGILAVVMSIVVMGGCSKPEKIITSFADAKNTLSKKLTSVGDLKDRRIGVLLGSAQERFATKTYPTATILRYKSLSDIVLAVKSGKADAGLYDELPLREIVRNDNELGMVDKSLFSIPIGIGFNKNSEELREKFNQFLREIKQNGVYDDMVDRWVNKGSTNMPEISKDNLNGVLVIGIVGDLGYPFTVFKDGKFIGYEIELSTRFAAYIGKEPKLADMEFGSMIAALASRKIDMIACSLFITEERKKQINFSDAYFEAGTYIIALKRNIAVHGATTSAKNTSLSFLEGVAQSFQINLVQEKRYLLILDGLKTTVIISILAALLGTSLGGLVCFMRMSERKVINLPAKVYISVLRGTPLLVVLMLIYYVVFASVDIDPILATIIAFAINFAAYVAEIFRTGIEGVEKGQAEAGIALGFTHFKTFIYIVLPQTVRRILPVYKGEFISLVKMTSIVGYIAVQDLTKASDIIRSRTFDALFPLIMVAVLYFLISWLLLQSLEHVELITDPKFKRRKVKIEL